MCIHVKCHCCQSDDLFTRAYLPTYKCATKIEKQKLTLHVQPVVSYQEEKDA